MEKQAILGHERVLDHGYVRFIEGWGSDEAIIEAARMSTDKGFLGWGVEEGCDNCGGAGREPGFGPNHLCRGGCQGTGQKVNKPGDEKLLKFLYEHKHSTPFEMAGLVIETQAPIFIFREWHRHRTQSYNEMSSRYVPLPDVNYLPSTDRLVSSSVEANQKNKQAGKIAEAGVISLDDALEFQSALSEHYDADEAFYQKWLKRGVVKELARVKIPVGRYSKMRASANLRNWLAFLTLRMDGAAQWEMRQYANAVGVLIAQRFPRTYELFLNEAVRGH